MTSISTIVVAHNHLTEVLRCLRSLQQTAVFDTAQPLEFLVADDASSEVNFMELLPPCTAKVIRRDVNGGFAANANTGAAFAQGDILLFLNQDTYALPQDANGNPFSVGWNIALAKTFESDPAIGIVGAKLLFPDGKIQSAGGIFDAHCQPAHRCLGYSDHTFAEVNTPQEVSWVTGAALAIRRSLFAEIGGFDEGYVRGYFEDTALCLSARERGYKVWYEPTVQLVHEVGTSGGNPDFMKNALRFKQAWVDTKKVKPDTYQLKERWW